MRWKIIIKITGFIGFFLAVFIIYLGWQKNLNFLEWTGLITLLIGMIGWSMKLIDWYFGMFPHFQKAELKHSKDLINNIFEKPIVSANMVYKDDKIQQTDLEWNETNPWFDFAINHLNNKKYKKTLYAYYNSKKYSELLIRKIINKIEKYREMVKYDLYDEHLTYFDGVDGQIIDWNKCINHIIYYEVIKNNEKRTSNKKLSLYQTKPDGMYYLRWWDVCPEGGMVNGRYVVKSEITIIKCLKNRMEQLIYDKNTKHAILDIDFLISCLKDNPNIKIFEKGRTEIVTQVKIDEKPLAGGCRKCP